MSYLKYAYPEKGVEKKHKKNKEHSLLEITIVTEIRSTGFVRVPQAGEKSRHIVKFDLITMDIISNNAKTGTTNLPIPISPYPIKLPSIKNVFESNLIGGNNETEKYFLQIEGQTASAVSAPIDLVKGKESSDSDVSINYKFYFILDFRAKKGFVVGSHDGFPSYSIIVDSKKIYDFQQTDFWFKHGITHLEDPMDISLLDKFIHNAKTSFDLKI